MTLDKTKLKADADTIFGNGPGLLMAIPAKDVRELLAEIERLETQVRLAGVSAELTVHQEVGRAVTRELALTVECDQLKAENEALRSLVISALDEGKGRAGSGGNAPGHCHAVPGVWDRGNGDRSGMACGWCRIWNAAQAMAKEVSHG